MKMLFWLLAFSCFSALGGSLARGHHAYAANYVDELGTIEGVVVEVFWGNPHVHYYLEVARGDGVMEIWDVESANLGVMARSGWTIETIEVGDRIQVSGDLGREGRRKLSLDRDSLKIL